MVKEIPCHFQQLFINSDGNVFPCCLVWGRPELMIGHIKDKDIEDKIMHFSGGSCECLSFSSRLRRANSDDIPQYSVFNIEVGLTCQAICAMCCVHAPEWTAQGKSYTYYDSVERLIERYRPAKILVQGGEVLIQKATMSWLSQLKSTYPAMQIALVTNGNASIDKISQVEEVFDELNVSFVGFQPATYYRIMGLDISKTFSFVEGLIQRGKVVVNPKFLVTPLNIHEAPLFLQWAVQQQVSLIWFMDAATDLYIKHDTWDNFWDKIIARTAKAIQSVLINGQQELKSRNAKVYFDKNTAAYYGINSDFIMQHPLLQDTLILEVSKDSQPTVKDSISVMDVLQLATDFRKKQVVVFGAGLSGERMLEALRLLAVPVQCCVDNSPHKQEGKLQGISICNPNLIADLVKDEVVVLVASKYYSEIAGQLRNMQLQEKVHFYDGLQLCEAIKC